MVPMDGEMVNSHLCTPVSHSNLSATNRDSQPYFRYNPLLGIACVAYLWDFFFFPKNITFITFSVGQLWFALGVLPDFGQFYP
jgi:hypothetical protein